MKAPATTSAWSPPSRAARERFRGTDPLVAGLTLRGLAEKVGFADDSGCIADARRTAATTFERLVREDCRKSH